MRQGYKLAFMFAAIITLSGCELLNEMANEQYSTSSSSSSGGNTYTCVSTSRSTGTSYHAGNHGSLFEAQRKAASACNIEHGDCITQCQ